MKNLQSWSDLLPETEEKSRPVPLSETENRKSGGESLAQAASAYIETHYREKFSLQKMADSLYVNGSYLLRTFKKYKNDTPLVYHNRIRCERAKELLSNSGEEVSEIGEKVGFVSSAHFSHVFKKVEGCTPSEYRMNHRAYWSFGSPSAASGNDPE